MEGHSDKVCKKMHRHVFEGENIDLRQVMKDVYENFTWIFKATVSRLERKMHILYEFQYFPLRKVLGFLITFSRCTLKRCVDKDGVINRSLVDILTDVESYFVDLLNFCTDHVSREEFMLWDQKEKERFRSMLLRAFRVFLALFSTDSSPPSTGFAHTEESLLEFVNQVLDDLYGCNSRQYWYSHYLNNEKMETFAENLESLRNCLQFTKDQWTHEALKEFMVSVEVFAENMACYSFVLMYGYFSSKEQHSQMKHRLEPKVGVAVLKAYELKLQDSPDTDHLSPWADGFLKSYVHFIQKNLQVLMNCDLTTHDKKDEIKSLCKYLESLVALVLNYPLPNHEAELEKLSDFRARFQTLVANLGSALLFSLNKEMRGNLATEAITLWITELCREASSLQRSINDIFLLIAFGRIGRNSPRTNQLGFLTYLVENLRELKDFPCNLKETSEAGGFRSIKEELISLRTFLQDTMGNNSTVDDDESKDLLNRIRCAASEAEHFINSCVAGSIPDPCSSPWFPDFKEQVKLIRATIEDISKKRSANDDSNHTDHVDSSKNPSSVALLPTTEVLVGFEDVMESIKERLTGELVKVDVVSIVGMPGLGKTTLAKKVFDDPSILGHFEISGWCCVSQNYDKKELLLTIFASITKLTADAHRMKSFGDLSKMLYHKLIGKKYLIVMDDMWGIDAFNDLKRFFPHDDNGSRIMLTSRNRLEDFKDPIELRHLTEDQSWDLLKKKIFPKDKKCPLKFIQVGKEIAKRCSGLPLTIVVVAGILAKSAMKHHLWELVAGNLSSYMAVQEQAMTACELSYKLLPDHLKPLFLYLGAFPEDSEIPANKLTWLWIAEGFVHKTDDDQLTNSLELQAELKLKDLIDRSLVMIAERRPDGRVKSCRVHDLLRDMCLGKAKEENFMRQINARDVSSDPVTYERRLGISINSRSYDTSRPFVIIEDRLPTVTIPPPLSSILFFNTNKKIFMEEEEMNSVFSNFRLLRIFHSETITVTANTYSDHVAKLVHLRYISFRTDWDSIPKSISKLWNLETLIIKGLRGEIVVPEEIWSLVKLRHLHINYRANFSDALLHGQSSSKLENLQTLSTPIVHSGEEKKLIQKIPNVRKLRCISVDVRTLHGSFEYQLPQLESLNHLESLKILCGSRVRCSGHFGLPSTLRKLTLSKFSLHWSEISSFDQNLPRLEVLKLRDGKFLDALWDTTQVLFSNLEFLKLENLNIEQWTNDSTNNFPCLNKLVLQRCKQLMEIPSSVGDFNSLQKIVVSGCSTFASNSAEQILKEQREYYANEKLEVQISDS